MGNQTSGEEDARPRNGPSIHLNVYEGGGEGQPQVQIPGFGMLAHQPNFVYMMIEHTYADGL